MNILSKKGWKVLIARMRHSRLLSQIISTGQSLHEQPINLTRWHADAEPTLLKVAQRDVLVR